MLKILSESKFSIEVEYNLVFETHSGNGRFGSGYCFPCDQNGNVKDLPEEAKKNYALCMSGDLALTRPPYVDEWVYEVNTPRVCECSNCGNGLEMVCDNEGLVYCHCGAIYNSVGQSIRPRSEWEERYDDDY